MEKHYCVYPEMLLLSFRELFYTHALLELYVHYHTQVAKNACKFDTHHHSERFPAVVSKCLFKLWWLPVAVPRSTKHPPPPPAAAAAAGFLGPDFRSRATMGVMADEESCSTLRTCVRVPPQMRECTHTPSGMFKNTRDNTRPHFNSCCLKQTSEKGNGAWYSIVNNSILELMDCQRA